MRLEKTPPRPLGHEKEMMKRVCDTLQSEVFVTNPPELIILPGSLDEASWLVDMRRVMLGPVFLDDVTTLLLTSLEAHFAGRDFQMGGIEVAGIPLVSGMVLKSIGRKNPRNGFILRKSRKKTGLLRSIEGTVTDTPIVLVDDLLNRGFSVLKQIELLTQLGKRVECVAVLMRFRDESEYDAITKRGIRIISLFSLSEFRPTWADALLRETTQPRYPYTMEWKFKSDGARYEWVIPKSAPLLSQGKVFVGSDSGNFYALDAESGTVLWKHRVLFGSQGKRIFSSPAYSNGTVYFGGYDGNFYALDAESGYRKWVAQDADWIGSSPWVSEKHGLVYVGMEFGFWKIRGGVAAYDLNTGERVWQSESGGLTHGSPVCSSLHDIVVCGSNNHIVSGLDAKTGRTLWEYDARGEVKARAVLSPSEKYVAMGSFGNAYFVLDLKSGKEVAYLETLGENYSTPCFDGDDVLIGASLDKHVYAWNIREKTVKWRYRTLGRIYGSPILHEMNVYCGANDALLHVINKETGKEVALFQATERITNAVVCDRERNRILVPTLGNEVIAITPLALTDSYI